MSENRTTQPCAAVSDRPWAQKKTHSVRDEIEAQYRQIGIAAVAAAASARAQPRKLPVR